MIIFNYAFLSGRGAGLLRKGALTGTSTMSFGPLTFIAPYQFNNHFYYKSNMEI